MSVSDPNHLERKKTNRIVAIAVLVFTFAIVITFSLLKLKQDRKQDKPWTIVATTGMIADAVTNITQGDAHVQTLLGPGVDPHAYKATSGDLKKINQADIVYYNGLHLEGKMDSILRKLSKSKKVYAVTDALEKGEIIRDPNFPEGVDPHFWFDIDLFMKAAQYVGETLKAAKPEQADVYEKNLQDYLSRLAALKKNITQQIETIPAQQRVLVTAHDAFSYFGRSLNIQVKALQGTSTMAEYGIKDITHLVETITKRNIKAIFVETSVPTKPIEAVVAGCKEKGHAVKIGGYLYSDAMGQAETPEGTYEGMLLYNVATIVRALK